jgi:hypothetical protein
MNARDARREAHRCLRDSTRSMARSVAEAERLLRLAAGVEDLDAVELRRNLQHEYSLNPEWFVAVPR